MIIHEAHRALSIKRRLAALLILLGILFLLPPSVVRADGEAADLTESVQVVITDGGASAAMLTDRRYSTYIDFVNDGEITFTSDEPISALYVVWQSPPEEWRVEAGGTTYIRGEYGFLHDTVKLEDPSNTVKLVWEDEWSQICDVYLFGEGSLPDWVQQWQAPEGPADLLLIPTHADDEHIYFGGAMPYYADRGDVIIQVAYMVNHNGEPYRLHEQLNGLWTAGVQRYPIIPEFPDVYSQSLEHAATIYNREEILAYQTELIRRFQPMVIVGHDLAGEYGHGAHMLNSDCLTEVIEKTADPDYFPESYQTYGGWQASKLYLHLYQENAIVMEWGEMTLPKFGGKTALQVAQDAFACHRSQQSWFEVLASGPYDCRKFGLYYSNVGLDAEGNDFFENLEVPRLSMIEPLPEPEEEPSASLEESAASGEPPFHASSMPEQTVEQAQLPPNDEPHIWLICLAWGVCAASLLLFLILLIAGRRNRKKR